MRVDNKKKKKDKTWCQNRPSKGKSLTLHLNDISILY